MAGTTISADVRSRLRDARVARLATIDPSHRPHLVPICFVSEDNVIYTAIDSKPKRVPANKLARVRNIKANPQVALLVDHYNANWNSLWYIQVRGRARLLPLSAKAERARALRLLRAKYPQYAKGMLPDDAIIIRITVERAISWGLE